MVSKFLFALTSLFVCVQCENLLEENNKNLFDLPKTKKTHYRHRHNIQSNYEPSLHWMQFLSDEPSYEEAVTYSGHGDGKSVENKDIRRTKFRQQQRIGGNNYNNNNRHNYGHGSGNQLGNNKKSIFRRGQRHRSNKNGYRLPADMDYTSDAGNSRDEGENYDRGLWPSIFNIAPKAILYANATCGQYAREEFCHTIDAHPQRQRKAKCGVCDANDTDRRHPIEYVIDGSQKWWQSPTLNNGLEYEYVTITLDLKQIYQVVFVSVKSAISPRPASWILERSFDGNEFFPWQYFGASDADCRNRYNLRGQNEPYALETDSQVICSTQFAKAIPLENGEIHLKLLDGRPGTMSNSSSSTLLDFTLARFVRIRLQGMHTTSPSSNNINWLVNRQELNKRSFYSLRFIKIGARLDCSGHAQRAKEYNSDDVIECDCVHNTCGVNCEKCCPLFNQKPFKQATLTDSNKCEKCECYGHSKECYYNPEVDQRGLSINTDGVFSGGGVCLNCSDLTTGINCEKCIANYYRPYGVSPGVKDPCVPCECNPEGSVGVCANIGGTCTCKLGFRGRKCSECASGYSGPNCTKCACDARGTMPGGECESHCQCKLHVEGKHCEKCMPSFFALTPDNPEGCIKCFCSGVGTSCESSNIKTNNYETLDEWKITDISRSFVMLPSKDNETGYLVFNMYEMTEADAIYWLAPDLYTGNKLQSYGSNFKFEISWVIVRGDTSGKPTVGPSLILVGENGMKIAYGDTIFLETNSTFIISLTEYGWYHVSRTTEDMGSQLRRTEYRGELVTRAQFLSVLSNVESMMLRGTFHTDQVESILIRATLNSAKTTEGYELGSSLVEQCKCPIGYTGLSCERCDFGYVRSYENTTALERLGICLPCSCNGHAENCHLTSNKCGECKHNTAGERCEHCANGFYGNARQGTPNDCQQCACPLLESSNNFSPTCKLRELNIDQNEVTNDYSLMSNINRDYVCTACPEGYIGDHCESCVDGYFGTPTILNSNCSKCPCNGGPCDPITGRCITCQGNTEGWRCERCKPRYWGDPTKGCELCRCHSTGSDDNFCDSKTGQCRCKTRYAGHQCDECAFGFANISLNCEPCGCNANGSIENFCDTRTGQCPCKMGVEELQCDQCIEGFYDLSIDGCQECRCNPYGSIGSSCNRQNGQCICRKNVTGRTCDKCADGYWHLESSNGCKSCECNTIGSINMNCSSYTGQCNCKPGVGGQTCDKCLEDFYGFSIHGCKSCDVCTNSAYNCDPESGRCVCPPFTRGVDCRQCLPNSWGWEHEKGCTLCNCDHIGAIGQTCDLYTGQCVCREGFTGRRCDSCSAGYFGYPACERCNCNRDGSYVANVSEAIGCDENGQCPCKSLVTGVKCDQCHPSTFGLSQLNTDGCTKCFCFGRTDQCEQSDLSWGQIRVGDARCLSVEYQNSEYVVVEEIVENRIIQHEEVIEIANGLSLVPKTAGNISIGSYRGFEVPLYFQMPQQFHGDRILSYAGLFRFDIEMEECKTELDKTILKQFPLVRIQSHNSLILDYFGPEIFNTKPNISYAVRFIEKNWRLHSNGQNATRSIIMTALQNISSIFVRGTTSIAFTRVIITNITLETGIFLSGSTNNLAKGVEMCDCPKPYNGSSCQDPAVGYYRVKETSVESSEHNSEHFIGRSVLCDCNDRSDRCDIETGYCEMCRNNTGGANCERCADGFYGDPNEFGCQSCPCPETHRNFARGCTFHQNRVSCICKPGYVGDLCDKCGIGYYGLPENEAGGCADCDCDPNGVVSMECDTLTGDCRCKSGVTGRRCDKCDHAKSILQNGHCKVCDNCTLTLLESSDELAYLLKTEASHIDLNGIPAPWPRLLMFDNTTQRLERDLGQFYAAKEKIENYNDLHIEKLNSKAVNSQNRWQKLLTKGIKRNQGSDAVRNDAVAFLRKINDIQNEAYERINVLNLFGTNNHHVNLPIALKEAQQLLQNIAEISHSQNSAYRAHQCASNLLDYWSNTSIILTAQVDETLQLKYDTINLKNRLHDAIQNAYKAFEIITKANTTQITNKKRYENLLHQHRKISHLRSNIIEIYNTSIVPKTDMIFDLIADNHEKIEQDLNNIVRLKTIVHEINIQCAHHLNNIRQNWIPVAEDHSRDLMMRAREYAKLFQNTKNGAEVAMFASTAYKNISEAIKSAHSSAIETKKAAAKSEEELYPSHSSSVIEKSLKSLKKSKEIHENSIREIDKLGDLEDSLKTHKKKVDSIKNTIWQTGLRNNNISMTLNRFSSNDTMEFMANTIDTATKISDQMREVRREAVDISSDVFKLKLKLASLEPQWAVKFGLAEENVSQSLRNIKDVKNTLNNLETVSARNGEKFHKYNQTLSVLMQELRDKIAKARHIAEGIRISMESKTSKCIRAYLPASFGLSTANTIRLSIALSSKHVTSPILFLQGEENKFLAIEMIKRKIHFVWNIGGGISSVVHPLELSKKDPAYDEAWYQIEANRTMNLASLLVRQMGMSSIKEQSIVHGASRPEFTRFVLGATNRLWIGAVPSDLRPKELMADEPGLGIILHKLYIDEKQVGLWNFMHSEGKCNGAISGAHVLTTSANIRHFNGQGYSVVKKERSKPYKKNFFALQMSFKTLDENALLFLAVDEKNNRSVSLTIHDGKIVFRIDYGGESKLEINTTKKYNTGQWVRVEVAREFTSKRSTENGSLKVNSEEPRTGSPTTPITSSLLPDLSKAVYYLGGLPPGFKSGTTKAPGADHAYLGCMKEVQINGETYDPLESSVRFGVETTCKETITRAGFYGKGHLELPNISLRKRANFGFVFRTQQPDCLLMLSVVPPHAMSNNYFDEKDLLSNYSVALKNGRLNVWIDAGRGRIELISNHTLNDGEYHTVSVVKSGRKFELRVDDEYEMNKSLSTQPFVINMVEEAGGLYFGGAPDVQEYSDLVASLDGLIGTIKDVVFNNQSLSFADILNFTSVDIGRDGPKMGYHEHFNDILMKTEPIGKSFTVAPEGCQRVGAYSYEANAFKFGDGPHSHSIVNIPVRHLWQNNFDIQFDFRTFYPNGLLFLVPGTKEKQKHFFVLILRNGQLNIVARGRKRVETIIPQKLNDGQWHRVTLNCVNKVLNIQIQIGTDTNVIVQENMKMPRRISTSNMMYVGGIVDNMISFSAELASKLEQFKGCIRRFHVNNSSQDLARPGRHFGIGQCFPKVEKGSYFPGDAYAVYKRIFHVGKHLELEFEFRTSEMNGVILSVSEPVGFPALSIELHTGKIVMSCDLGDGNPFRIESNLPSKFALCDNRWHNISAMYDSEQIALRIDNLPAFNLLTQHEISGKVHTKSALYIGGLPDTAPSGTLLSRENFKGCIRNVVIRNELKDWTDMDELQNVLLSECLAMS